MVSIQYDVPWNPAEDLGVNILSSCTQIPKKQSHSIQIPAYILQMWCHTSLDTPMPIRNCSSFDFSPTYSF